jgi:acylphosphatase
MIDAVAGTADGWVRNRRDGTVEALVAGPAEAVARVIAACRRGPPAARVAQVRDSAADDPGPIGFERRPTL